MTDWSNDWWDYEHFTVKEWQDCRRGATPTDADALQDLEARLSAYTDFVFGLPGKPGTQYLSSNLGQLSITAPTYGSAATPDKVSFQLAQAQLVRVHAQLNAWHSSGLQTNVRLFINNVAVVNERGNMVQGNFIGAAEMGVVMREDQVTLGVALVQAALVAPFVDVAAGLDLWLAAGTYDVELKYATGGPTGFISKRRLAVLT